MHYGVDLPYDAFFYYEVRDAFEILGPEERVTMDTELCLKSINDLSCSICIDSVESNPEVPEVFVLSFYCLNSLVHALEPLSYLVAPQLMGILFSIPCDVHFGKFRSGSCIRAPKNQRSLAETKSIFDF